MQSLAKNTLFPLFLIIVCPSFVMMTWYANVALDGSYERLWNLMVDNGFWNTLSTIWGTRILGSKTAWMILGFFAVFELALMRLLPGKEFKGPVTPHGYVPTYKANGIAAYSTTMAVYLIAAYPLGLFSPTLIYDHFGEILGALNCFSLLFCLFLMIKGRYAPSCPDADPTGNLIFDYYWGIELYPRILGWNIKMFTNCRLAMMAWPLILLSFAAKQHQLYGLSDSMAVAVALQLLYVTKFFIWETGYLGSLDIMHDKAGFYICWGVLVWLPGIYTSPTLYLVNHPNHLGPYLASAIFFCGAVSILLNYFVDLQRQRVRELQGNCLIWGRKPLLIQASYTTLDGEKKKNLLLASGWWGISRHFHYIPELSAAFFWSVPALFDHFLPYFYLSFLTILLVHRAFRDDERCLKKYGKDWIKYCHLVPYKLIPFIV